jgi:hypothetical protein
MRTAISVIVLLGALGFSACASTTRWVSFRLGPGRAATVRVEGDDAESEVRNGGPGEVEVGATTSPGTPPRTESLTFGRKSVTIEGPAMYTVRSVSDEGAAVSLEARDADDVKLESMR